VRELHDIVECLCDVDGAARVVTFQDCSWIGIEDLVTTLRAFFERYSATYTDEEVRHDPDPHAVVLSVQEKGTGHLVFDAGTGLLNQLQIFVSHENEGNPLVELVFFPEDVDKKNLRETFIVWVREMHKLLQAQCYYARYENHSWRLGDVGPESGVFLVSRDPDKDA
jgi:hypothetical protein